MRLRIGQQVFQVGDGLFHLLQLVQYLLALQVGQAAQLHVEDGLRLYLGELEALHQGVAGGLGVGRLPDGLDDLVQEVEGDFEAFQDVGAVPGDAQLELRAARDDLAPEIDEELQRFFEAR